MARFHFDLEPELMRRRDRREAIERKLGQARRDLALASQQHRLSISKCEVAAQRVARARDDLTKPKPGGGRALADAADFLAGLVLALRNAEVLAAHRDEERRSREHRCRAVAVELGEAQAEVRTLEKLRERREHEFRKAAERRAERLRDDDALLAWNHRRRSEP
ncbi:MAG: hypothetical protein KDB53_08700 [Planctomycetes bacterium]|nr:hypothetical protein [Planctomycetota bacterium]